MGRVIRATDIKESDYGTPAYTTLTESATTTALRT